jgi:hypothetical protein
LAESRNWRIWGFSQGISGFDGHFRLREHCHLFSEYLSGQFGIADNLEAYGIDIGCLGTNFPPDRVGSSAKSPTATSPSESETVTTAGGVCMWKLESNLVKVATTEIVQGTN